MAFSPLSTAFSFRNARLPSSSSSFSSSSPPPSRAFSPPRASVADPYSTLGVPFGASEEQIKKARRKLALKFHPDVCKDNSCTAKFIQIEQAYETIMDCLNGKKAEPQYEYMYEGSMGINDDSWEDWEEWMGWEGAGIRDYSSHINHSIP